MSKEPVGSVGEEAAKLFAALQQAAGDARSGHASSEADRHTGTPTDGRDTRVGAEPARGDADPRPGHEHSTAGTAPECQWCPVCQLIAKVRNTSPETVEQVATVAAGVLGSVRSLVEAAAESARQARAEAEARAARAGRTGPPTSGDDTQAGWHEGAEPGWPAADGRPAGPGPDRIDVSEDPEPWD